MTRKGKGPLAVSLAAVLLLGFGAGVPCVAQDAGSYRLTLGDAARLAAKRSPSVLEAGARVEAAAGAGEAEHVGPAAVPERQRGGWTTLVQHGFVRSRFSHDSRPAAPLRPPGSGSGTGAQRGRPRDCGHTPRGLRRHGEEAQRRSGSRRRTHGDDGGGGGRRDHGRRCLPHGAPRPRGGHGPRAGSEARTRAPRHCAQPAPGRRRGGARRHQGRGTVGHGEGAARGGQAPRGGGGALAKEGPAPSRRCTHGAPGRPAVPGGG